MTETKEQELKPCPFCGGAMFIKPFGGRYYAAHTDSVKDKECFLGEFNLGTPIYETPGIVIDYWNRRAETPAPQWRQEPPTEEGWYWHWIDRWDTPIPVRILRNRENILINTQTGFSVEPLACNITTYWSKMIAPPPLPTEGRAE